MAQKSGQKGLDMYFKAIVPNFSPFQGMHWVKNKNLVIHYLVVFDTMHTLIAEKI